jgi:hypothetical protein
MPGIIPITITIPIPTPVAIAFLFIVPIVILIPSIMPISTFPMKISITVLERGEGGVRGQTKKSPEAQKQKKSVREYLAEMPPPPPMYMTPFVFRCLGVRVLFVGVGDSVAGLFRSFFLHECRLL